MRLLTAFLCFSLLTPSIAFAQSAPETEAKQAIIVDYGTGAILFEKNADERMPTSSMSKTMTLYMVFDALKKGTVKLDDTFVVSEKAWRMGGSKMFVELNSRIGVEDLVRGVSIQSGNDATIVLAEGLAGTEEAFASASTAKAKELGMLNTHFINASGWPDPMHYSTARDLATLGAAMVRDFPDYYHYLGEKEFTYHKIVQHNRNPLLYRNVGADGIKTGHTEEAGYGLIGSGVSSEGRRVVLVVNGLPSDSARAQESARLMEWALSGFTNKTVAKAGQVVTEAKVVYGKETKVGLGVANDAVLTLPKMMTEKMKVEAVYQGPLIAPIANGQQVGKLVVSIPGQQTPLELPLVATQEVKEQGLFSKVFSKIGIMIFGA